MRVLGKNSLYYEELETVLCDVEAVINSRPLTYISEDPEDFSPLTPANFLMLDSSHDVADLDEVEKNCFQKRYRYRQRIREDLRKRFRKEYLAQLIQNSKKNISEINIGDIVLIGSDFKKRIAWPLGRVIQLHPGRDGHTRVVRLQTFKGEIVRPVQSLYLLETMEKEDI